LLAIALTVDGVVIPRASYTYDKATDRLAYTPIERMTYGWHSVVVEATDEVGLSTSRRWSFKIAAL
jgi:hypothetical protein